MSERDFDMKVFIPNLKEVVDNYEIRYDENDLVPSDDQAADRLFQAGVNFLARVGVYCQDTNRVIQFTREEILHPEGWTMLAFISDPRTGLGYKRSFTISNFELMKKLPQLLRTRKVDDILKLSDFQERVKLYQEENKKYEQLITQTARIEGDAIIIDFRNRKSIPVGNRFLEYVLYPEQNISIRIADGKSKAFAMISVGHSIINPTSSVDVGSLTLKYGGGGHKQVGTCQVSYEDADRVVGEMLEVINAS